MSPSNSDTLPGEFARGWVGERETVEEVTSVGISIVVPICGIRGCLHRGLRDIRGRALGSVRVVYISSNSASSSYGVTRRFTTTSSEFIIVGRRGNNTNTTEGGNLHRTGNGCLSFLSSSSFFRPSVLRGTCRGTRRAGTSFIIFNSSRCFRSSGRFGPVS